MTKKLAFDDVRSDKNSNAAISEKTMASGLSCVGTMWAILSFVTAVVSCVGYFMPFWIRGTVRFSNGTETFIGLFRRCNYPALTSGGRVEVVRECGRYTTFADIPSPWWQAATISVGVGCGLIVLVTFVAIAACCLKGVVTRTTAKCAGIIQFTAGRWRFAVFVSFIFRTVWRICENFSFGGAL